MGTLLLFNVNAVMTFNFVRYVEPNYIGTWRLATCANIITSIGTRETNQNCV